MKTSLTRIARYGLVGSLSGLALFIPFSISGENISIGFVLLAMILATAVDPGSRRRYRAILRDPFVAGALVLAVSALPSVFMSDDFTRAFSDWQSYWQLLVYVLVAYNVTSSHQRRVLCWLVFTSLTAACGVAFVEYFGGLDVGFIHIEDQNFRPTGTLGTMTFSGILYQLITVNFGIVLDGRRTLRNAGILSAGALVWTTSLLVTLTRGAWLALVSGVAAVVLMLRRRVVYVGGLAIVATAVSFAVVNPTTRARIGETVHHFQTQTDVNISTRFILWGIAWDLFSENPFFGVGMGDYSTEAEKRLDGRYVTTTVDSHNIYLQTLATRGLFGFAGFIFYWLMLFRMLLRARVGASEGFDRGLVTGVVGAAIAILIGALTENNIDDAEVQVAFMFILGLARSAQLSPNGEAPAP